MLAIRKHSRRTGGCGESSPAPNHPELSLCALGALCGEESGPSLTRRNEKPAATGSVAAGLPGAFVTRRRGGCRGSAC